MFASKTATLIASIGVLASATCASASFHSYYVGIDKLQTIASGAYAGLPNPNHQRLTFLYAHVYPESPTSNHYHSKGTKIYTGPNLGANTQVITTPSDFVPEGANPPVALQPGNGLYAGKLVSTPYNIGGEPYSWSDTTLGNTKSLDGHGPNDGKTYLFHSSNGRWNAAFNAAHVHWELVSLTPGLNVGNATSLQIAQQPGDDVHVGDGDELFEFTPLFWTDAAATNGIYEAKFRLVDESGNYGTSSDIRFRVVVPEPATLSALAGLTLVVRRRR